MLAAYLRNSGEGSSDSIAAPRDAAFNFGPSAGDHRTVQELVSEILKYWDGTWEKVPRKGAPAETNILRLDAGKARRVLGWRPRWHFEKAVAKSVEWYRGAKNPRAARELTRRQIAEFSANLP
jgi:CDP-glucose 4,6-dehydratase